MKNKFKLIGIIAIVAVIGLSMIACDDDDKGSTETVTFEVTNNHSLDVERILIDIDGTGNGFHDETATIAANGGTYTFTAKMKKFSQGFHVYVDVYFDEGQASSRNQYNSGQEYFNSNTIEIVVTGTGNSGVTVTAK